MNAGRHCYRIWGRPHGTLSTVSTSCMWLACVCSYDLQLLCTVCYIYCCERRVQSGNFLVIEYAERFMVREASFPPPPKTPLPSDPPKNCSLNFSLLFFYMTNWCRSQLVYTWCLITPWNYRQIHKSVWLFIHYVNRAEIASYSNTRTPKAKHESERNLHRKTK